MVTYLLLEAVNPNEWKSISTFHQYYVLSSINLFSSIKICSFGSFTIREIRRIIVLKYEVMLFCNGSFVIYDTYIYSKISFTYQTTRHTFSSSVTIQRQADLNLSLQVLCTVSLHILYKMSQISLMLHVLWSEFKVWISRQDGFLDVSWNVTYVCISIFRL
jgi:hypothetical protein